MKGVERVLAVGRHPDVEAFQFEEAPQHLARIAVILDNQH